jgi:adenylosuccinate synthase
VAQRAAAGRCVVVVGCQWGDEGKGKIVDVLAEGMDLVARYQGGANAGHTVHVGDEEFILHQIPSGILHPDKRCLLGNGVVLDLVQFFQEYEALAGRGVDVEGRVGVSLRAHLLLPYHRLLDQVSEDRAEEKIGTTGRGIGPAYEEKTGRRGIRVADLRDGRRFRDLLARRQEEARARIGKLDTAASDALDAGLERCHELCSRLLELATDVGLEVDRALKAEHRVLLEGAQGTALDLDHGTYPFVTSSNTIAGAACAGTGVGPKDIDEVWGVAKAYATRVGSGPFPTELDDELGLAIREAGGEYGTTTGRRRRVGWFDGVLARYADRVNGFTDLFLTKLDVLSSFEMLRVAVAYRYDGRAYHHFPPHQSIFHHAEPVYEELPGWGSDITAVTDYDDLPREARDYVDFLEAQSGTAITWVSVGPKRSQTLVRRDVPLVPGG